jgi:sodium transport system permease protein
VSTSTNDNLSNVAKTRSPIMRVLRLSRKELRESLRDRRTLMTLIVMPLIVYPLLGSVVQKFAINRFDPNSPPALVVFDVSIPEAAAEAMLQPPDSGRTPAEGPTNKPGDDDKTSTENTNDPASLQDVATSLTGSETGSAIGALTNSDQESVRPIRLRRYKQPVKREFMEEFLQAGEADVGVLQTVASIDEATGIVRPSDFQIISRQGDAFSQQAAVEVEKRVLAFRDRELRKLLDTTRFGSAVLPTISKRSITNDAPKSSPLGAFIPLMLVLMTMTGAVYPAIDLTAGERERGTLEILMAAPVSKAHLLTGKFIAVLTVAVLTAVINLVAMLLTLYATGFDRVLLADGARCSFPF